VANASDISVDPNGIASIVKNVANSVVSVNLTIESQNFFGQTGETDGAGSGIIYAEDNDKVYIATNNHVIEDADKVTVSLDDKTQVEAHFVGSDEQSDLAMIYVNKADLDKTGVHYTVASFGDSSKLEVGDEVIAIGNAMGEGKTATSGIISAINKQITVDGKTLDVLQTDAAINPGNSGGALVDSDGDIIGINTAKLSSSQVEGMGYSIPSNVAKPILDNLKTNGSVQKPYLGIQGTSITAQMKDMYNLPSLGVYVVAVTQGSGAEAAGLQPTDIIVGYDNTQINSMDDLSACLAKAKIGDKVTLYIYRNGVTPMTLTATITNMNSDSNF
jgi:serine protease Do